MAAKVPIINEINLQQAHPNKSSSIEGKQTKKDDQQLDCASSTILQKRSNSSSRNDETKIEAEHAANMRLKFRKSHTCGSLFAKCNCSTTDESASIITARVQAATPTTTSSCLGLNVTSSAAAVNPFHLSISPTTTLSSSTSLCTRHTSSGISSLSTQTSSATSAHLSHDESISFDYEGAVGLETMPQLSFEHQVNNSDIQKSPRLTSKQLKVPSISTQIPVESNSNKEHLLSISSSPRKITERSSNTRKLVQSYSHPDTDFLFTKENNSKHFESHTTDSNQATLYPQNKYKRSSSPHIGNYQLLNVAIHPDFVVRVSPTHSPLSEHRRFRGNSTPKSSPSTPRSAQQKRRLLQRSHEIKSDGSTSGSDNSFDLDRHTITTTAIVQSRDKESSDTSNTLKEDKAEAIGKVDSSFNAAQKYFAESGILGPINTSSNLIRKTSKILQDSNVIEQIRKTSMIFRGNLTSNSSNTNISSSNNKKTTTPSDLKLSHNNLTMESAASVPFSQSSPKSPHTMATTCGFSPNVTTKSCVATDDRDAQIKSLQGEVVSLKDVIKSRDAEIIKLRREIHKLKSVLQQTTNHLPIVSDELLQGTPTTIISCDKDVTLCSHCKKEIWKEEYISGVDSSTTKSNKDATCVTCAPESNDKSTTQQAGIENSKLLKLATTPVLKKQGVSGESCENSMQLSNNMPIAKYEKDFSSKQLIKEAIMDNDFLKNIDASQVRELVESMYSLTVTKGEFVIREGEVGAHLYVSAEGEFEVVRNGKVLGIMGPGKAFGELAILYNCTRTASIRVLSDARLWVLDRRVFQQIMMRTGMQRIENSVQFLKSVPLLRNLSDEVLAKIADVLEVEFYAAGTYIIRQGASGDTFFLISQGSVKVTQKLSPNGEEEDIRTLESGDYFGEQALINEDKRTANIIANAPGVECLTLDRDSFSHLIGDLCELKEKNYGDKSRVLAMKNVEKTQEIFGGNVKQDFPDMKLTDLEVIATLGIGGFGRVELVKAYHKNKVDVFALKCLKKRHIVDTKQEEHIYSERTIMLSCNSPFICRLYRTFRDSKYVYMLLEACMGGEIWTMLRDRKCFDDNATQFIIGCVLQAFEYLHSRGIIYRDLKPENLMLDERGYVKLVDFGFAKYIGNSSKTWTFCGTPEYVAPEIILNKGHDRAVDYWALGILIHELLNGTPPFTDSDPMKTYNIILKGIDMIDFPKHMSRSAVQLIKKLCRDVPVERLGYQKGGIQDIKKHKWFLGFDWDGLQSQLLIPPFVRPISHSTDTCYFDKFPCDPNEPPDEFSGWDKDF